MEDRWKYEEVQIIKIALEGAALSKNYVYYVLDVPHIREEKVFDYIKKERLFTREPIKSPGDVYTETRLLVPKERAHSIRRELLKRGAEAIITIPITSITGLNNKNNNERP